MRIIFSVVLMGLALAPTAFGQAGQALRRAREISNQNNVRQGVPSPAQTQPTVAAPLQTNGLTQAQSLVALRNSLAGFKPGTVATEPQKQQLTVAMTRAVRGNKPSPGALKKFVDSLAAVMSGASFSDEQRSRLASNLDAVLNSRGLAATQFDKIIEDTQATLQVGAVKRLAATSLVADLKAIGAEIRH